MPTVIDEHKLIAKVCRSSYFEFLKEFWYCFCPEKPIWNWHIEFMCNELQIVCERVFLGLPKLYDLVVNISPGSSKSSAASIALLPWCWTRMPTMRCINGSHTHDLVLDLSRKSREIVYSEKYQKCFPEIILRQDQNTKGYWTNTLGGARMSCTVAGRSPMGFHGHIHVIDDPIDPKKAVSDIEIEQANTWMIETLATRKVEKSVTPTVLIMQRLAQNDPSGYKLSQAAKGIGGRVRHVCLPAEITDSIRPARLKGFYKDGLMDPIRISRKVLDEESEKSDYFYSSQFLQDPIPLGGGMFQTDMLQIKNVAPNPWHFKKIVRCWDNAGAPRKNKGDRRRAYTVGLKMGLHKDGSWWILDVQRGRFRVDERENLKAKCAKEDGVNVTIVQEQEGGSGGQESVEYTIKNLAGYHVVVDNPKGEKVLRAEPLSSQVNISNVFLVKAKWNRELIEEMKHFPNSTFKDQVDAAGCAFNYLFKPRRRVGAF